MFFNKLKISAIIGFVVLTFSLAYASEPNPTDAQIKHERTKLLAHFSLLDIENIAPWRKERKFHDSVYKEIVNFWIDAKFKRGIFDPNRIGNGIVEFDIKPDDPNYKYTPANFNALVFVNYLYFFGLADGKAHFDQLLKQCKLSSDDIEKVKLYQKVLFESITKNPSYGNPILRSSLPLPFLDPKYPELLADKFDLVCKVLKNKYKNFGSEIEAALEDVKKYIIQLDLLDGARRFNNIYCFVNNVDTRVDVFLAKIGDKVRMLSESGEGNGKYYDLTDIFKEADEKAETEMKEDKSTYIRYGMDTSLHKDKDHGINKLYTCHANLTVLTFTSDTWNTQDSNGVKKRIELHWPARTIYFPPKKIRERNVPDTYYEAYPSLHMIKRNMILAGEMKEALNKILTDVTKQAKKYKNTETNYEKKVQIEQIKTFLKNALKNAIDKIKNDRYLPSLRNIFPSDKNITSDEAYKYIVEWLFFELYIEYNLKISNDDYKFLLERLLE